MIEEPKAGSKNTNKQIPACSDRTSFDGLLYVWHGLMILTLKFNFPSPGPLVLAWSTVLQIFFYW